MTQAQSGSTFLTPGAPVDLDNCAREPIHVPGRIQPRGALLVVRESDGVLLQCSENLGELAGRPTGSLLGRPLADAVGRAAASAVLHHVATTPDLAAHNPVLLAVEPPGGGPAVPLDAVVHRPPLPADAAGVLVVELEPVAGLRPLTFPTTYQSVRGALGDLERAASLQELYDGAAHHVRELTGFDRVMIYRFDDDYNGEVAAEARRADLNSFLGLHYPASDIPPQARALYEKNWIRLIADVDYVPCEIVPVDLPVTGQPLDLTYSTLRSVSPIHLEYLRNMGVRASMSISLLQDGKLWGLIACHHYDGPHAPAYEVRTAAEFLGSILSVRLVAQADDEREVAARRGARVLAGLVADSRDDDVPLAEALTRDTRVLDMVRADAAFVVAEGVEAWTGTVEPEGAAAIARWVSDHDEEVVVTESLARVAPDVARAAPGVAGVLAVALPDGQVLVWLRDEVVRSVDWGGDPHNKALALGEDASVRLSPRLSFDRWREVVRGHSTPWAEHEVDSATTLRSHLVEALYLRGRREVRGAEALQRSLLPEVLPQVDGWALDARYEPSGGSFVGGDWYDAFTLPGGRIALVVGDVTGHGLAAAASMGQLRNALRALLLPSRSAADSVRLLDEHVRWMMPDQVATLVVVVLDPATGEVEHVSAGHPPMLLLDGQGGSRWAATARLPPLGLVARASAPASRYDDAVGRDRVEPGGALVLYSDGLVERRTESLRVGLDRLAESFAECAAAATGVTGPDRIDQVVRRTRDTTSTDDATLLVVHRLL
ncbi:SpoIIE family protein phosphatase [Oerskovia flava]|uniref:SpoIIE family protein phosphatase n=1 Tax=Oerskovia flava TaxID=2986422 RepID=UPI002240DBC5|nr:SpoIIE family protein phosphatase [Oerskovia sp. JB1-3-2]